MSLGKISLIALVFIGSVAMADWNGAWSGAGIRFLSSQNSPVTCPYVRLNVSQDGTHLNISGWSICKQVDTILFPNLEIRNQTEIWQRHQKVGRISDKEIVMEVFGMGGLTSFELSQRPDSEAVLSVAQFAGSDNVSVLNARLARESASR
jgi:hypothetical protein